MTDQKRFTMTGGQLIFVIANPRCLQTTSLGIQEGGVAISHLSLGLYKKERSPYPASWAQADSLAMTKNAGLKNTIRPTTAMLTVTASL